MILYRSSSLPLPSAYVAVLLSSSAALADEAFPAKLAVTSPDSRLAIELSLGEGGRPVYRVDRGRDAVIQPSGLGFLLAEGVDWTRGFDSIELIDKNEHDSTWTTVWGERSKVRDRHRAATVRYRRKTPPAELMVEVRAYEEGVAFRYLIDKASGAASEEAANDATGARTVRIESEKSEFRLTGDPAVWAVTSAQGKYSRVRLSEIKGSIERPCIVETPSGMTIAIAEAALVDYARMRLRRSEANGDTLVSNLHGVVNAQLPLKTPWRVVMAAENAGQLLERNYLLLNLNEPCAIEDTSWIKPGKVIREVTLSTEGGKACVDFCVEHGLQFIEYDAGWYGPEGDEKSDARTVSRPNLDLQEVIRYGKQRGIGVIVYVNRRHLERQLDKERVRAVDVDVVIEKILLGNGEKHLPLVRLPRRAPRLRAADEDRAKFLSAVGDRLARLAAARRRDSLAVDPGLDEDRITGLREGCRGRDRADRSLSVAGRRVIPLW